MCMLICFYTMYIIDLLYIAHICNNQYIDNLCLYDMLLNIMYHFEEGLMADERKLNEQPSIIKDYYYYYY